VVRGLPYITLPPEINLANPALSDFFKTASYTLEKGDGQTIFGESIYFSFSIPNTVKNMDGAGSFSTFILSPNGRRTILDDQGLNIIRPVIEGNMTSIPSCVRNAIDGQESSQLLTSQQ
jgi:molybdate/tungstate transport system substrate-binding protein